MPKSVQLIAEKLIIERGGQVIVDRLSFSVASGEALVLIGPNGAGKTTLLRALAGFLPLASGSIRLTPDDDETPRAERMHAIGHANAVKAHLTVRENIAFWAEFLGSPDGAEARIAHAMDVFGLEELSEFPASYLSAGQRRRVGLARLLVAPRPVWLLDEPSVSLDATNTERLAAVINAHTAAGGIAIAATHLPLGLDGARELALTRAPIRHVEGAVA